MPAPASHRRPYGASAAVLGLVLLCFGFLWLDYREFWLDDAFITLRYARNLAEGHGAVFNPSDLGAASIAAEGYTNFLWMLATSSFFALTGGEAALGGIKLLGLALGAFTLARVYSFPGPDGPRHRPGALLLAMHPVYVANCGDGLESPLFMALAIECARLLVGRLDGRSGAIAGLLTAGMTLTRPEALPLLVVIPLLVWWIERGRAEPQVELRAWTRYFLLAGLLPIAAHVVWRIQYYGALLPNTYYAKATGDSALRLTRGLRHIGRFAWGSSAIGAATTWLGLLLSVLATASILHRRGSARWLAMLWGFVVFRVGFATWSGGEFMGVYRFLSPLLPFVCVLADEGARSVWQTRNAPMRIALLALCGVAIFFGVRDHRSLLKTREAYRIGLDRGHIALGKWLRANYPPDTLLAVSDAGAIPFYSRLPTIDAWGLNTAEIARLPGEYGARPGMPDWVFARQPGLIVLWNRDPVGGAGGRVRLVPGMQLDRDLFLHPEFKRHYRFVREFVYRESKRAAGGYYLDLFERSSRE